MKKKVFLKLVSVLLILASMVTLVACSSDSKDDKGEEEMNVTEEGLTFSLTPNGMGYNLLSARECEEENIVIPATYGSQGLPVTGIVKTAFGENTTVKSIYIPEGVTYLYAETFKECTVLEKIEVAEANPDFTSIDG